MRSSLLFAVVATVCWGFWAFFVKLATRTGQPETVLVVSYAVGSGVGVVYFLLTPGAVAIGGRDLVFAVAAGLATGLGSALYYAGLDGGDVGRVTTIAGLYFLVSAALGVLLLNEAVTARKLVGTGFAVVAVGLLAS